MKNNLIYIILTVFLLIYLLANYFNKYKHKFKHAKNKISLFLFIINSFFNK